MNFYILTECGFTRLAVREIITGVTRKIGLSCSVYDYGKLSDISGNSRVDTNINVLCDNRVDYLNVINNVQTRNVTLIPDTVQELMALIVNNHTSRGEDTLKDISKILTPAEQKTVDGLLTGCTQKLLAEFGGVSVKRISARKRSAMIKLGARTSQELFYLYSAHKNLSHIVLRG
jgi:DNA-binding NarL/FixJ family response regulator